MNDWITDRAIANRYALISVSGFYDIDTDVLPHDAMIGDEVVPFKSLPGETRARFAAMLQLFSTWHSETPIAFEGIVRHLAHNGIRFDTVPDAVAIGRTSDKVPIGGLPPRTGAQMAALLERFSGLHAEDPVAFEAVVRYVALRIESPSAEP